MRLTKKFCALVSSLAAVTASAQGVAQVQPPAPAGANPAADDARLRDALRRALQGDTPPPASPVVPIAPATPPAPAITDGPITAPSVTTRSYTFPTTNAVMIPMSTNATTVALSLEEAIMLALEHNRDIQVERYTPIITEYDRRALYGYYDPALAASWTRTHSERESGGFNQNTGNTFDTSSETKGDIFAFGLGGYLPSGMRYDINENFSHTDATFREIDPLSTNQTVVINRNDTWAVAGTATARQPLLRNFWIDAPRLQIKLARRFVRISELELERYVMDIINQVEQAYYILVANRELVRAGEADVNVKRQFFDEQHRRVEVGALAPLDEKLAQAELALSELNLHTARKNAVDAEAVLKGLIHDNFIGRINTHLDLTDRMLAIPPQLELFDAFKEATDKRPDLQAQRIRLEQLQIQLKYDFNQLFPALDVFGTYGLNGLDLNLRGALEDQRQRNIPQYSFGLALTTPLTMWRERNNLKSTKAAKAQEIRRLKALEELVVQEVDFQVRLMRTTWNILPLLRQRVKYQEDALEAEKKKLDAGKSTTFNVLQIASDLTQARTEEIGTLRDYNQAISELNFRKGTTLERWRINPPPRTDP
ncbi:MAG TPA: TolC family protein [Methylomirabilota bacterium]|nr:TolC family protein [Methylomirabilota bacterium]